MWWMFIVLPVLVLIFGVLLEYILRKISARIQFRIGPMFIVYSDLRSIFGLTRVFQALYDVLKLFYKETIVPKTAHKFLFISSPIISLTCLLISSYFLSYFGFSPLGSHEASIEFIIYLIVSGTFFLIVGGLSSGSPWGIIGSKREIELFILYEFALISSVSSIAILVGSFSTFKIVNVQVEYYPFILLNPFAAITLILAIIGKLHLNPFEIPEANVEVVAGQFSEYSGKLLALVIMFRYVLMSILSILFVDLFLSGGIVIKTASILSIIINFVVFVILCILVVVVASLIHLLTSRFRIDQAFSWSIKFLLPLSIWSIIFSFIIRGVMLGGM
ncbi:MAG: complex I subunit 1 family protein [Candidatus Methanomethylicia archaeon]